MNVISLLGKKFTVYLAAVLASYLLASVVATQHVANALVSMGIGLGARDRLSMVFSDLLGMSLSLLPMIAFGLLFAFLAAALLLRLLPGSRPWRRPFLYVLAGFTALVTIHVAMNLAFGLTPIAVARTNTGLLMQGMAGAVGGYLYLRLGDAWFPQSPFAIDP